MSATKRGSQPGKTKTGMERRRFARLEAKLTVSYRTLPVMRTATTMSRDVSGGGVRLHLDEPIAPNTLLRIEISWPGRRAPMRLVGKVVWCSPCLDTARHGKPVEAGIRFMRISPKDRLAIIKYVETSVEGGRRVGRTAARRGLANAAR